MSETLQPPRTSARLAPVFIIGEARSGTSLLYRTLQKHPSFATSTESLHEPHVFTYLPLLFCFGRRFPRSMQRFLLDDEREWRAFLREVRGHRLLSLLTAVPSVVLRPQPRWLVAASRSDEVVRRYFAAARRARGCARLVEKTPRNAAHVPQLLAAFPEAKLLYIHRHPVDVYSSYRRRSQTDGAAAWTRISVEAFCRRWAGNVDAVLRHQERAPLLLIRYEDFTADPHAGFRRVCEFLDEPFEPEAVQERNPDLGRWKADPHLYGGIVPRTKEWRDYVPTADARAIEDALATRMRRLGHRRYT